MVARRLGLTLTLALALSIAGCPGNPNPPGDTGPATGDMGMRPDTGPSDGGTMTTVTVCPGDSLPPLASGVCEVTAGSGAGLLIQADVLAPDQLYRGGQVFVDSTGTIMCVGCDCSSASGAAAATHVTCPDGVLSPGLVNAHEHITYQGTPRAPTAERYEHRSDWREPAPGHTHPPSPRAPMPAVNIPWAELRMVMGGATSINADVPASLAADAQGFLRDLDQASDEQGLGRPAVVYDTFPLNDISSYYQATSGCDGYSTSRVTLAMIMGDNAYTPHIAEGIGLSARNEFLCQSSGAYDLIQPQTAMIHGVGLLPVDMQLVASAGSTLIWSPRSNVSLYGDTARVVEYDQAGVPIAIGTDWIYSGSMNMLRELQCADELNATYFGAHFSDEALWRMATYNGAVALGVDDVLGAIQVGKVADLAIFDGSIHLDYRAVIDAGPGDVALVLRSGVPLYGEDAVVMGLPMGGASCDTIDVCGHPRRACVMREIGMSLSALTSANSAMYPLFDCTGMPHNEPSCRPERDAMAPLPLPTVDGSNSYSGMTSADDTDGDGIANAMDDCPSVFNPIRPMDMGMQADSDMDGLGDSCDPCPLDAHTTTCSMATPGDRDRDGVPDATDNCPSVANADQADADMDGHGDACDPCPHAANPGSAACPSTIYAVQMGTVTSGSAVAIHGVVTAVGTSGFFLQTPTADPDYTVPDYSGVFVFTSTAPSVTVGAAAMVTGTVGAYMGETEITMPTVTTSGTATVPAPVDVMASDIATGGTRARALEGVLARVMNVMVTDTMPAPGTGDMAPTYEFVVDTSLRVDDMLYRITPFAAMGESFASITGVVAVRYGNSRLLPRAIDDYVAGAPTLVGLTPAMSYTRAGAMDMATFPMPLSVQLARAGATDTVIALASSGAELTVPASVTVPAGSASAPVLVTGVSASPSVTVTATLGSPQTATVRVLGASEGPTTFTLSPAMVTLGTGMMTTFTLTLDLPAPLGGQPFTLADTTGGMVATSTSVPMNQLTTTFPFTAGSSATTGTLTASALSMMQVASLMITAGPPGHLVINEIDYDQPGTDTTEFIELYNGASTAVDLSHVAVVLINGSGNTEYGRATLSGMLASHAYLIVAPATSMVVVPSGVTRVNFPSSVASIQNGPDGLALFDTSTNMVLDALCYEGAITAATISGMTYSLVEGTALPASVADAGAGSLSRIPDGVDTNDSATDWMDVTTSTPGVAN